MVKSRRNSTLVVDSKGENGISLTTEPVEGHSKVDSKRISYSIKVSAAISNRSRRISSTLAKEISVVLMNLLSCVRKDKNLSYSRSNTTNKKIKRYNRRLIDNRKIMKAIDLLEQQGYCKNFIASNKQDPRKKMTPSFIQPTQKFINEFCSSDEILVFAEQAHYLSNEPIILRDVDGNDIDYKDTPQSIEARELVVKLNTISANCVFKSRDDKELENFYSRIFNLGDATFSAGGRFARSDLQNMSNKEDERLFITIDGQPVVEVDYSNLHIRLLTDLHGVDYSKYKDCDLYHMPLSDEQLTADNRWLIKQSVNIMFNCSSERAAMAAIQDKMRHAPEREFSFSGPKQVVTAIKAAYPWLADDFCQEIPRGHYLMNLDSWIAHTVATEFADAGLPIGIIHDSFIVQEVYRDKLIYAMTSSYRKWTKREDANVYMKLKYAEIHPLADTQIIEEIIIADFQAP